MSDDSVHFDPQSELIRSRERYRSFVSQSTEGIWRFEMESPIPINLPGERFIDEAYRVGYLAECNDAMARMYGFDHAEQLIGARLGDLLVRDRPENVAYLLAFRDGGFKLTDAESQEIDRNGNTKFFLNNLIGVIEDAKLARAWGTQRDITERKRMEEELRRAADEARAARDAAEAANRAKNDFLSVLSHELRTPLTPMLLLVALLEQNPQLPASAREDLQSIRQNIEFEARLIDDLLDLSRITRGTLKLSMKPIDLHQAIRAAVDMARTTPEAPPIDVELNATRTRVHGDFPRVQQIVWNLLSNAIKFTPQSGSVRVRSSNEPDGRVRVEVIDTGVGINPDEVQTVFNAFQHDRVTTRQFGGLGIGLAIAQWLAKSHAGDLRAASAGKGQGATFTLTLPALDE